MSAEMYESAFREIARRARVARHPHKAGCSGKGDVVIAKSDYKKKQDFFDEETIIGEITYCSTCNFVKKSGTLINEDYEPPGLYYLRQMYN